MPLLLIKDRYNRIDFLGKAELKTPDPSWLAMQKKPFAKDAVFYHAYPITGGACSVDAQDIEILREATQQDIDDMKKHGFNPAAEKILALFQSPPALPDFLQEKLDRVTS
jgi:hypothetical protein